MPRHGITCPCMNCCARFEGQGLQWDLDRGRYVRPRGERGGWGPRTVGSIEGNDVTIREGFGQNEGHTLISDGQQSARAFDRAHNHYGPRREDEGRVDEDRGHYTGPGH